MSVSKQKNPQETTHVRKKIKKNLNINYKIQLSEEQKQAKRLILENKITILTGKAGTGKTLLAIAVAIDLLFKEEIEKIYITRPVVTREEIGFLPGGISEKMDPFLIPIFDCLRAVYTDEEKISQLIRDKVIDIAPVAFMRGRTIRNAVLIIDECQNLPTESLVMCLTRLGKDGKIIACGDSAQIDLKTKRDSGMHFLKSLCNKIKDYICIELLDNHRDPIIEDILASYEIYQAELDMLQTIHQTTTYKRTGS